MFFSHPFPGSTTFIVYVHSAASAHIVLPPAEVVDTAKNDRFESENKK